MGDRVKTPPTAPSLIGKNIYLHPATPEDIANTNHWQLMSEPQMLQESAAIIQSASAAGEQFKKSADDGQTFMIVRSKDNRPIGRVRYFAVNMHNRSAMFDVLVDPDERRDGLGKAGFMRMAGYLFEQRGLNRVWTIVAEPNHAAMAFLEACGCQVDGKLRQQFYFDGGHHDGVIYSMLRYEHPGQ